MRESNNHDTFKNVSGGSVSSQKKGTHQHALQLGMTELQNSAKDERIINEHKDLYLSYYDKFIDQGNSPEQACTNAIAVVSLNLSAQ